MCTVAARMILVNTRVPATALMILSFIFLFYYEPGSPEGDPGSCCVPVSPEGDTATVLRPLRGDAVRVY